MSKSYRIQGRTVTLPVEVRLASNATAVFVADAAKVTRLLPDAAFEVVEAAPGTTHVMLSLIDYVDNDLGDYDEVSVAFTVSPRGAGAGAAGSFIYKLPVNQSFTCEAGCRIWGFPKSVERIDFSQSDTAITGRLEMAGQKVFELTLPIGGVGQAWSMDAWTYTYIDGIPHRTPMSTRGTAVVNPPGVPPKLELGQHPLSQTLRSLDLSEKPVLTTWIPEFRGSFGVPEKL